MLQTENVLGYKLMLKELRKSTELEIREITAHLLELQNEEVDLRRQL